MSIHRLRSICGFSNFNRHVAKSLALNGSLSSRFLSSSKEFQRNNYVRSRPIQRSQPSRHNQRHITLDESIEIRAPEVGTPETTAAPSHLQGLRAQYPLKGKVTVVTGSASGLGHAMAKAALAAGSHVAMVDLNGTASSLICYGVAKVH